MPTGIPAFMEQIQRNLHLFGRYGITMFAISGLDIALWDLAAKDQGRTAASTDRRRQAREDSRLCEPAAHRQARSRSPANARPRGGSAIPRSSCTRPRRPPCLPRARRSVPGVPLMVDMNCPLQGPEAIAFAQACLRQS